MIRPDLSPREVGLDVAYVNQLLGLSLGAGEIKGLLERMRFGVEGDGNSLKVKVPSSSKPGVQLKAPVVALIVAPVGAPGSKLKVSVLG